MQEFITEIFHCNECETEFVILLDGNDLSPEQSCPVCMNDNDFDICTRKVTIDKIKPKEGIWAK